MEDCVSEDELLAHIAGQGKGGSLLAHVDGCSRCRRLIAYAVENGDSAVSRSPAIGSRETTMQIGAIVAGRYEIRRFLGRGGMGEVHEAWDTELGDLVALKTLALTALDDTQAVTRLKAEVLLARRVAHPNVCRIFDLGVHEITRAERDTERVPFLTMELLRGETLGQRLRREGPLRDREAQTIVDQMVAGLTEVHRAGIIHRDLKSENVFIAKSATGKRAVLMDFGLARSAPPPDQVGISSVHNLVGTAAYMSPEQIQHKTLGPTSDIYALGVVMYEIMTGKLPFTGTTPFDVAVERLQRLPPSPRTVNPDVPPAWERTIMKCLAIDPADRFQRVTEVQDALDGSSPERGGRWRVALASSAAALSIGIAAAWLYLPPRKGTKGKVPPQASSVVPAVLSQPFVSPEPMPGTDHGRAVDIDKSGTTPHSSLTAGSSATRRLAARNKVAHLPTTRDAVEVSPTPPAGEAQATEEPPPPDYLPARWDAPLGRQRGETENAPEPTAPADGIFNPFTRGTSRP